MPLKIAIPNKGRLSEDTLGALRNVGIRVPRGIDRALIATTGDGRFQALFTRAADIPEFVEIGAADVGITGLDIIEETGCKVERKLDLGYGRCRLILAAPDSSGIKGIEDITPGMRVATSFPNLTRRYFARKRKKVTIIPISGAAEITPSIGVADLITDLTQTGSTLKQNHLVELDVVMESWAVLVARPGLKGALGQDADDLVHALESVRNASGKRYLMANVPRSKVSTIIKLIPGVESPTVMDLAAKDMVAVHAVVGEADVNALVPRLKKAGARGILILPIERMVP